MGKIFRKKDKNSGEKVFFEIFQEKLGNLENSDSETKG